MTTAPLPEFDEPLTTLERAELVERLLNSAQSFAALVAALDAPSQDWEPWVASALRPSPNAGEPLEALLRRWWVVFESEVRLIQESRNRIVHGVPVPDGELRRADYLARRLSEITFREAS